MPYDINLIEELKKRKLSCVRSSKTIQRKFKNKTLAVLSLTYITSWIIVSIISIKLVNSIAIPLVLGFYVLCKICYSVWLVLKEKYVRNFTTEVTRLKVVSSFELILNTCAAVFSLIGAIIIEFLTIEYAILIVGLVGLMAVVLSLDYMRTRFGLKPKQYTKEDLEF